MWTNIDTDTRTIQVNRHDVEVEVSIDVRDEDNGPEGDFDFGDADANAEYLARFESGELSLVCIRVTATALGEEGTDYLGMCHVRSGDASDDVESLVVEYAMVEQALAELEHRIEQRANVLAPYAKGTAK